MLIRCLLAVVALGCAPRLTPAADYAWNNAAGGQWATAANWTPAGSPGLADNVTINLAGTYAVGMAGDLAANNVTLNAAGATVGGAFSGGTFTLGGTMLLNAGTWTAGALLDTPASFTGGTITRSGGGTGRLVIDGDARFTNTQINANVLELGRSGALLRLAGTSNLMATSTLNFTNAGGPYASVTAVRYESSATLNATINVTDQVTVGAAPNTTLTIGPTGVVNFVATRDYGPAVLGRLFEDGNAGVVHVVNNGTVRATGGQLYVGRYFDLANSPSNVNVTNNALMESTFDITFNVNQFNNQPGGVLRARNGGSAFVFARTNWDNDGTFEVTGTDASGNGSLLLLGGLFSRANMGTIVRDAASTIGIYAGWMDNAGGTWALSAATGSYHLYGQEIGGSGRIIGGAVTASGGAKLIVRPIPGGYTAVDYCRLTGVAVGPGVLDFSATGGKVWLEQGTTLAAGDTITLAGTDTAVAYFQTQQVDGVTFVLAGNESALQAFDNNVLTLGPTSTVRKTGTGVGKLTGGLFSQTSGTDTAIVNRGLVRAEQGTLRASGNSGFTFTNRGTVRVDAGATFDGVLNTDGGTVAGGGTVSGPVTFAGTGNELRPGGESAPGRLSVTGNATLNAGTTLFTRLNGATVGTGHDQLAVTGTVALGDAALSLSLGGGYAPAAGDKLFLVTNDGTDAISGRFAGLADGAAVAVGDGYATVGYFGDAGTGALAGGNDVVLYDFRPVPEPATVLGVAALGLLGVRRLVQGRRLAPRVAPTGEPSGSFQEHGPPGVARGASDRL